MKAEQKKALGMFADRLKHLVGSGDINENTFCFGAPDTPCEVDGVNCRDCALRTGASLSDTINLLKELSL